MAILNNLRPDEYNIVQNIINEVLLHRKVRFDVETVLEIIKTKSLENKISKEFLDCSYFYILVLNTLDRLVEEGKFYQMNSYYIPVDFLILVDYIPQPYRLLYFINDNNKQKFVDIVSLEEVSYEAINGFDFILCGGYNKSYDNDYQGLFQSDISIEEVSKLYHELINECASNEYAMVLILNHYKIQSLSYDLNLINDYSKNKPQIKKLSRKKITHKVNE